MAYWSHAIYDVITNNNIEMTLYHGDYEYLIGNKKVGKRKSVIKKSVKESR